MQQVKNPIVRWRADGRITADGKKTLFIHEIQAPSAENQAKMPDWARKRWREIGLKSALDYAVKNGYDSLSLASGEQVAGLYDLSKHVDEIQWSNDGPTINVRAFGKDDHFDKSVTPDKLDDLVGKEIANKINSSINAGKAKGSLSGLDLKVGGEGIKKLYDKDLPSILSDMGKKFGAKVSTVGIDTGKGATRIDESKFHDEWHVMSGSTILHTEKTHADAVNWMRDNRNIQEPVTTIPITPSMRQSITEEGQPLFKREEYKLKSASEDIQKTVKTLTDKIPTLKGKVEVVKSETDLPDHLKSEVKSRGFEGTVEGVFDPKDGKVYVVSNNIFGANRVEQVLRHELTHRGIRNVLGDKVKPVFQQIYKQFENTKEMSKVITDYDLNTDKEGGKLTAVDEFIARHGEQYQKQPVIQRMISMIRHELRKMGFIIKWSDKDIMNLAGAALKSEGMGEEIRFSTKGKESKSNLNPFQREQVKTPEFKRWFGESKVVDENGEPLIAYHGSPTMKDIAEFKNGSIEKGDFGPAIYFDESRFVAQHFTGEGRPDQVGEFYIKANNPLDFTKGNKAVAKQLEPLIDSMEANHRKVYDRWANGEIDVKNAYRFLANSFTDMKGPKEFNEKLQSIGIDGIIDYGTSGVSEGSKQIAVFDPSQIKSATGNTGEFNPKNKDIRFSRKNAEEDEYNHLQKIPRSQLTPEQVEQLKKKFGKVRN